MVLKFEDVGWGGSRQFIKALERRDIHRSHRQQISVIIIEGNVRRGRPKKPSLREYQPSYAYNLMRGAFDKIQSLSSIYVYISSIIPIGV